MHQVESRLQTGDYDDCRSKASSHATFPEGYAKTWSKNCKQFEGVELEGGAKREGEIEGDIRGKGEVNVV